MAINEKKLTKALKDHEKKKAKKKVVKKKKGNGEVGYKKPPKQHQFKKGEVRNPKGINISPERRALKDLTEKSLSDAIQKVFTSTEQECLELLNDKETSLGHKLILRAAVDATQNGNYTKFNEILERVLGKVPTKVDMTTKGESINITTEDRTKIKTLVKEVENEY